MFFHAFKVFGGKGLIGSDTAPYGAKADQLFVWNMGIQITMNGLST